jgi:hypothetical protein
MKASFLFFLSLYMGIAALAQPVIQPQGGGGYRTEPSECITPVQRDAIRQRLDSVRKKAGQQKKLKKSKQTLRSATKTTALMTWPLQQVGTSYNSYYGISNYVDHDLAYPGSLLDWNCGKRTYDLSSGYNHGGIDIFLWPFVWNMMEDEAVSIVAAAPGTIIGKDDGEPDHQCAMGSAPWNAVYIEHADGTEAWYGHMKAGSLTTLGIGATVAAGTFLGFVGSSGSSTGPHLHFELHDASGSVIDAYNGPCNTTGSLWTTPRPYNESQVNTLMTHFAPPGFAPCPGRDTINARDTFAPGSKIYFAAYYHDQLAGQNTVYSILRPDGSTYSSWTHSSAKDWYAASYWYWNFTVPSAQPTGRWKFKAVYEGNTSIHDFFILVPSREAVVGANAGAVFYPNPVNEVLHLKATTVVSVQLYDALGHTVLTAGSGTTELNTSTLPAGLYYLKVCDQETSSIQKVIKL